MTPRPTLLILLAFAAAATAQSNNQLHTQPDVQIGVLSLFHPHVLLLRSAQPLTLTLDERTLTLAPNQLARLVTTPCGLTVQAPDTQITAHTLTLPASTFTLTVPAKLTRTYRGALRITLDGATLSPVVTMPAELAVQSIVAAESPPDAPFEALKAQAIVSRSYLLARPHAHRTFDSCDTTHCQFLREPPPASSAAAQATTATAGLILTWRPGPGQPAQPVAAMYARSCGGHTHPHPTPGAYPFYPVACNFCLRHPERWTRPSPLHPPVSETERLAFNRTHGWSAIPSNTHTVATGSLTGQGNGHGIGLCQVGAADLAVHGASAERILARYFPNTTLSAVR